MITTNNVDLKKRYDLDKEIEITENKDFFQLSREYITVLIESSPFNVLHKGREVEEKKKKDHHCFTTYL